MQGGSGDAVTENRPVDTVREGEGGTNCIRGVEAPPPPHVRGMSRGKLLSDAGSSAWGSVGARRVGWGERQEGGSRRRGHVHLWPTHADGRQTPTQYCKAIILHLKINTFLKKCVSVSRSVVSDSLQPHGLKKSNQLHQNIKGRKGNPVGSS